MKDAVRRAAGGVRPRARRARAALLRRTGPRGPVAHVRALRDANVRRLQRAVRAGRRGVLSADEAGWVERIEELRERVTTSEEVVPDKRTEPRTVGQIARRASQAPESATVLMKVVRVLRPRYCVELGTCVGISTAYQAAALALNGGGRMVTLEGYATLAEAARRNFADLGLDNVEVRTGKFKDTLDGAIEGTRVDYAFVDGHHDEHATLRYHAQLVAVARPGTVLVFDDINWSAGMRRAWERIAADPSTRHASEVGRLGFCVVDGPAGASPRAAR